MGIKFLAIAFVAFLSLQGCVEAKHIDLVDERGLVEDIAKVIEEIKEALNKLIIEGIQAVKNALEHILALAKDEVKKAIEQIHDLVSGVLAEIKQLEELAIELGLDIKECVEAQKGRLQDLVQKTIDGIHGCAADLKTEAQKHVEELIASSTAAYNTVLALAKEFNECKDLVCRVAVVKKAKAESERIGQEISGIVAAAINDIKEKLPVTVECIHGQVAAYTKEVESIVGDVHECILSAGNVKDIATRGIIEDVKKLIEDLKKAVEDVINGGLAALKEAQEKVQKLIENIINEALNKVLELAAAIKAEIEEIKKQAAELGEHVLKCVEAAAAKVDVLVEDSLGKLNVCKEGVLVHVASIIQKVVNVADGVKKDLADIIKTVGGCGLLDPVCWINVAAKATGLMARLTTEIPKLIASSLSEVAGASAEVTVCTAPVVADYIVGIDGIRKEIGQCLLS